MTPEGKVKEKVKALLKEHGAWYTMPRGQTYGIAGVPDFLVCFRGCFLGIETKAGNNLPRANQKLQMKAIRENGGYTFVVNDDPATLGILETWIKNAEKAFRKADGAHFGPM